jgi:hypothetical protein
MICGAGSASSLRWRYRATICALAVPAAQAGASRSRHCWLRVASPEPNPGEPLREPPPGG